jgi:hypothetical protein
MMSVSARKGAGGPDNGVVWHDPTWGRIDRDIQQLVDEMEPESLGQRVAMENTLQERRNRRDRRSK